MPFKITFKFLFALQFIYASAEGQEVNSIVTHVIGEEKFCDSLHLGGNLDAENTTYYKDWRTLQIGYSPLKRIVLRNLSPELLQNPRLVINKKNYYEEDFFIPSIVEKCKSAKDTTLAVFNFVKNNIVGRMHPDAEAFLKYKSMFVYGYSPCDAFADGIGYIFQFLGKTNQEVLMTHHHVTQVRFNDQKYLLDGQESVFYVDYDNRTFSDIQRIMDDKYLIKRTKHLGLSDNIPDYYNRSLFTASIYYNPSTPNFSRQQDYSLDFTLKPNEAIIFDYKEADKFHELDQHGWGTTLDDVKSVISNSYHIYQQNFTQAPLDVVLDGTENMCLGEHVNHPRLHVCDSSSEGVFVLRFALPFPLLDISLKMQFHRATATDQINIEYSTDSLLWKNIYQSHQLGVYEDSVSLSDEVAPLEKLALYQYFLRFRFSANDSAWASGIDSLYIVNTFQCSRFFLPQLSLGNNIIEYTDANGENTNRQVELTLEWQEDNENRPPAKVIQSIFPVDNSSVDSLNFTFYWEEAIDPDGDDIADYEFMLSTDDRMFYPLSPNFHQYVSAQREDPLRPCFKVKENGWLNDGETYYWRVRARDSKGVWGVWSDTWSFTAYGLMRPIDGKAEVFDQNLVISWEGNPKGKPADFYKIYASDETNGFMPIPELYLDQCDSTVFIIPFQPHSAPKSFYRIVACDSQGQESLLSDVIEAPYPLLYGSRDSVRTGSGFRYELLSNERFYPYFQMSACTTMYQPKIQLHSIPVWLQYRDCVLSCDDTTMARKLVFLPDSVRKISATLDDLYGGKREQSVFIETREKNRQPILALQANEICEGEYFKSWITSVDGDVLFGDTHQYQILDMPRWIDFYRVGDTIRLYGAAVGEDVYDTIIRIQAIDSKRDTSISTFVLKITPHLQVTSPSTDTLLEDQAWSYTPSVNRLSIDGLRLTTIASPDWIKTNSSSFTIQGTPRIHNLKDTVIQFLIWDQYCEDYAEKSLSLYIEHVNHPPSFVCDILPDATEDSLYSFPVLAEDIDSLVEEQNIRYQLIPNHSWLTIDSLTGILSGTPFAQHREDSVVLITVYDKYYDSACRAFRIHVRPNEATSIQRTYSDSVFQILIYPSVSEGVYFAKIIATQHISFRYHIFSVQGHLLISSPLHTLSSGEHVFTLDLRNFFPGVYLFVGSADRGTTKSVKFTR